MKWYEREFTFKSQPYPLFLTDVAWSAVTVMTVAVGLFLFDANVAAIAVAGTATTLLLGRMIVRRAAHHRAETGLVPARSLGVTPLTGSRRAAGI
ncbi:MAG TPA: hypothetical protein VLK84_27370 [Longimicrobium sp.]|nr:hypothetical protein [Longimicrobium sp.]